MIKISFVLFCLTSIVIANAAHYSKEWQEWTKNFESKRIVRRSVELNQRYQNFQKNLKLINEHNIRFLRNETTYQLGLNEFADHSLDELFDLFDTRFDVPKEIVQISKKSITKRLNKKIAISINWASQGYLPAVQSQGPKCGSCYAFASVAAVESAFAIKNGLRNDLVKKLSEQQIIDCSSSNNGCKGGFTYYALDYVKDNGLESFNQYPYFGNKSSCKYSESKVVTKIKEIKIINANDIQTMKEVLNKQPIVGHLAIMSDFFFYKSGVYLGNKCAPKCGENVRNGRRFITNHMVLIVGYGVAENGQEYWICRNSYGPNWGENGYFRIPSGRQTCCIENWMYYPVI